MIVVRVWTFHGFRPEQALEDIIDSTPVFRWVRSVQPSKSYCKGSSIIVDIIKCVHMVLFFCVTFPKKYFENVAF